MRNFGMQVSSWLLSTAAHCSDDFCITSHHASRIDRVHLETVTALHMHGGFRLNSAFVTAAMLWWLLRARARLGWRAKANPAKATNPPQCCFKT
jgi:hypothetical protein